VLLEGKVVLIAGNATEIGQATAIAMSGAGASVVIGDREIDPWLCTIATIQANGAAVLFQPTDVTVARSVRTLVTQVVNIFGKLDAAFNNTCTNTTQAPLAEQEEFEVVGVIDQNLNGLWLCLKYEIEQMLKGEGGAIVNHSSVFGLTGCANDAIYVSTQHAVTGITKAAAIDYAQRGIRVNAVAPSLATQTIPMGRTVRPQEVANAVVWLCSDQASFITGHTLPIDGGFTAQ
jgi:NAD(P)-dependent dehydrogenase (short-subunit alcohol dehydrogenase family)